MRSMKRLLLCVLLSITILAGAQAKKAVSGPPKVTSPKEFFGANIGDDYFLSTYTQFTAYWQKLATESDRMRLVEIGKTEEGRPQWMAIVTSPENHKKLDYYKNIVRRLTLAEGLTDEEAKKLAADGKAVVWIDGGLHATEVLGAHQLLETEYQMISRTDPETMRFLNDVIILFVHANPDGMELVSNWYMRNPDPTKRSTQGIPRLYQKYIGHDNNRDFYLSSQAETTNMNRILYSEWFPQIMYNHHQTGPAGAVLFAPPFRDPFNYLYDPLIPAGLDLVGAAMHNRFIAENKPGATTRRGANYSTWFNGGLRTTTYFHNMIGLLTETIGNPTPMEIPFVPNRLLPTSDLFYPITPQKWHFRQSIEYSVTANRAVMDVASRHREQFLYNIYQMGRNSIEKGNRDTWTTTPKRIEAVRAAVAKDNPRAAQADRGPTFIRVGGGLAAGLPAKYFDMMRDPANRDPRGYILPSNQADFPTAVKFINSLLKTGITVQRATAEFTVAGKKYPGGSYVVKSAQAFRPHVLDMFEPQDHPNDFLYPGGPPIPPYDVAGYTLAYQMGVQFDRILEGFDGPFEKVSGLQKPPVEKVSGAGTAGFLLDHHQNDAFTAINRLLKNGDDVYWMKDGALFVSAKSSTAAVLEKASGELGVKVSGVASRPAGESLKLRAPRIGIWDRYGGNMPSGWTKWMFEKFELPYQVVFPKELDAGNLTAKFDVLIFPDGGISSRGRGGAAPEGADPDRAAFTQEPDSSRVPPEFQGWLGRVTVERTIPQLKKFLEDGGTIIAIGGSTNIGEMLGLPVSNHLVERSPEGQLRPLPREKFYIPGSVLRVKVDTSQPIAQGMPAQVDVFFNNSPVIRLEPEAIRMGIKPVAWFSDPTPLRSGWAWGQQYLQDGVTVAEAPVGKGKLFLFGSEVNFRGQPHGTFKFLFNAIYYGTAR